MVVVFCRTLFMYLFLLLTMRLMGKRQIGELQISELIVTLMLSELAVNPISNPDMPLLYAIVPILLLLSLEVILSFWMTKSNRMKKLLTGSPAFLIRRGKLDQETMLANRLEIDELLSELRQNGYGDLEEIEYAILEGNGKISVFPKVTASPLMVGDVGIEKAEKGIGHAVIIDGEIMAEALHYANKNEKWLEKQLREKGCVLKEVFFMSVDDTGAVYLVRKEKKK